MKAVECDCVSHAVSVVDCPPGAAPNYYGFGLGPGAWIGRGVSFIDFFSTIGTFVFGTPAYVIYTISSLAQAFFCLIAIYPLMIIMRLNEIAGFQMEAIQVKTEECLDNAIHLAHEALQGLKVVPRIPLQIIRIVADFFGIFFPEIGKVGRLKTTALLDSLDVTTEDRRNTIETQ